MTKKSAKVDSVFQLKKRLKALEESYNILEQSLSAANIVSWKYDFKTETLLIDKAHQILDFEKNTSFKLGQLIKRVHPDDANILENNFPKYLEKYPDSHEYFFRVRNKDNIYRWVTSIGKLIKNDNDLPESIVGTLRDITYRKETEAAFFSSENKLRLIADHAHEGIVLYENDIITDINDQVKRIFGYDLKKYIGKNTNHFFADFSFKKIKGSGGTDSNHYECSASDKDQEPIFIEIFKYQGKANNGLILLYNITERKKSELRLRKQHSDLQSNLELKEKEVEEKDQVIDSSQQSYKNLLQNLQGVAYKYRSVDKAMTKWKTEFISDGSYKLLGYKSREVESNQVKIEDLIKSKELKDEVWRKIKADIKKRETFNVQYPIVTKTGETKWVSDSGLGVFDKKGDLISLEGAIIDITEEKQRELAYSNLLKNMQGMAYRSKVNENDLESKFISEGCFELTGYTAEEIMRQPQFFEHKIVAKEYQDSVWQIIKKAIYSRKVYEVTYPIITKKNERKWAFERGVGVYDTENELVEVEGVIVDVTKAKEQEKKYRLAQETIERAPIIIQWIREDGSFHYVNDHAVEASGYSKKEFYSRKIHEIDPLVSKKRWKEIFKERQESDLNDFEITFAKKDGSNFPCIVSASNIEFEGSIYNCAYISDINELKEAQLKLKKANDELTASEEELRMQSEELVSLNENLEIQKGELERTVHKLKNTQDQLVQAEKMASLGVLVAGIAHELNNPINYIRSGIEALQSVMADMQVFLKTYGKIDEHNVGNLLTQIEELNSDISFEELTKDFQKMLTNINDGADQASEIVKGLRTFSRLDKEKTELQNIHQNIDNVLLMLRNSYKYDIKIEKHFGEIPPIECAPGQINQVFMNLISNAIQAIEGAGTLTIKTEVKGNRVSISVSDTGSGIDEKNKKRIFEPFFTTKEPGEGTGLGLSISLGIVQDHNGSINLESSEQGTTFIVTLPVKQSESVE